MQTAEPPIPTRNPFRARVEPPLPPRPDELSVQTDLTTSPAALEREPPSPPGAHSRSPSPEVAGPPPSSDAPHSSPPPAPQRYAPPPGPPPTASAPSQLPIDEAIAEELPPAYTPTADVRQGETSIEFGPRRPFSSTPARGAARGAARANGGAGYVTWQRTQRPSWQPTYTNSPGRMVYAGTAPVRRPPPGPPLINIAPPPQHPVVSRSTGSQSSRPPQPSLPPQASQPPQRPLSDFARDFYTAGPRNPAEQNDTGILAGPSSRYDGSGANGQDAPPMPPRPNEGQETEEGQADDGRPTHKPVPGHPLLNSGKVLVYPAGYECNKCHNTGYKHYDPSNPCTKCWSKYAKVYSGPLTYAPWSSSSDATAAESSAGHNLQRPLPKQSRHRQSHSMTDLSVPPPPHPDLGRSASASRQYNGYPGAYARSQPQPTSNGAWPPTSWAQSSPTSPGGVQYAGAPPPGATVVRPGDPRIGGKLCWRCGGNGVTSFLIFDEQTCPVCNGLGRTF